MIKLFEQKLKLFVKRFIEFHIRLIYSIAENSYIYTIYIFTLMYAFYGNIIEGLSFFRFISCTTIVYLILISSILHLICVLVGWRLFLIKLIGESLSLKYILYFRSSKLLMTSIILVNMVYMFKVAILVFGDFLI